MKRILSLIFLLLFFFKQSDSQVNLNAGLTAYYPFNGNANDASGNGLNGIVTNGPQLTTDKYGAANSAYHFDGVDDVIIVSDNGKLSTPTYTLAYYFSTESSTHQVCLGKINYLDGNGATYNSGLNVNGASNTWFNIAVTNSPCFQQIPGTDFSPHVGTASIPLNEWHCIVNTFENGNEKIYLDGQLISSEILPFTTGKYCTNTDFLIGSWWIGDLRPFKGKLDEVRVYNRVINNDEIVALCSATPDQEYIINQYTEVTGYDPCKNTLLVNDASGFNTGDTVLLIQMKGAIIDTTNTASFGNIIDYKNAGNYEFNIVKQKNGNGLDLLNVITRQYDIPNGKVQLVRVPYFQDYTVPAGNRLTCLPWDGSKGGIVAVNVASSLTLNGDVDVSEKGFKGGKGKNINRDITVCFQDDFFYPSTTLEGAQKGEGIAIVQPDKANGRGDAANGGGGGNEHNSGGGGGGNGTTGGLGGYQLNGCGNAPHDNRGFGGRALTYSNADNKVFLGGGGGAGHCNNPPGFNSDGGNGGGIIFINANQIVSNGYSIVSNGQQGLGCVDNGQFGYCHEGMGGGGAGGSIILSVNNFSDAASIKLAGGKGADMTGGPYGILGPGGGGSGGICWLNAVALPANVTVSQNGGINGVNTDYGNDQWGSTPGTNGINLFNLQIPIDNVLFTPNLDSVKINNARVGCNDFDFKGIGFTKNTPVTSWQWQFGDGANSTSQNISHSYANKGQYSVILTGNDGNNCPAKDTVLVDITPLAIQVSNDTVICKNSSVQLLVTGGTIFNWSPASGLNDPTIQNPIATPSAKTTYHVDIKDALGCTNSDSVTVSIRPDPVFTILPDTEICVTKTAQLGASGGNQYAWQPSGSLNNASLANPVASPIITTTYTVVARDTVCGASANLSTTITVIPSPVVKATKSNDIDCSIGYSQLSATGAANYQWSPSLFLNNPLIANPVSTTTTPMQYVVTGTNAEGCSSRDSVLVDVKAINKSLYLMPSAFTPNNDGKNDCFRAKSWGFVTDFDFSIFNRWGERVFHTTNPSQCWDGTYKGVAQKADVYVYIIKAKSICESSVFRKGTVTLIR